jgi:hypothetical protein
MLYHKYLKYESIKKLIFLSFCGLFGYSYVIIIIKKKANKNSYEERYLTTKNYIIISILALFIDHSKNFSYKKQHLCNIIKKNLFCSGEKETSA